jgi:hypothetical protein
MNKNALVLKMLATHYYCFCWRHAKFSNLFSHAFQRGKGQTGEGNQFKFSLK